MRLRVIYLLSLLQCVSLSYSYGQDSLMQHPKLRHYIAPAVLIGYGLVSLGQDNGLRRLDFSTHGEIKEDHPAFVMKADDYLRYVPVVAMYGLDLAGLKSRSNVMDRSIMLLSSFAIVSLSVSTVKGVSNRERPSGSNDNSFPSGHTAMAFMTAEMLHQEYKDQSIWISIGGYSLAAGTGVLRLYNNAHWLSDVVAGAGFGILSTKLTYLIYPYLKEKFVHGQPIDLMVSPGYVHGSLTMNIVKRF